MVDDDEGRTNEEEDRDGMPKKLVIMFENVVCSETISGKSNWEENSVIVSIDIWSIIPLPL